MGPIELLFTAAMGVAAACDLRSRRIPNRVNVTILIVGLAARAALGGIAGAAWGAAGAALGLALLLVPFQARWIGAGDVKLVAAIGAWLGPMGILWTTLFGLAAGGLVALAIAVTGGRTLRAEVATNLKAALFALQAPAAPVRERRYLVPMAVPLGAAAVAVVLYLGGIHA